MFDLKVAKTSTAKAVNDALQTIAKKQVYVGIPESNAARQTDTVNNAQLMYIHTNGSPINHLPARPVIEPAIEAPGNKEMIVDELKGAAEAALDGDQAGMETGLKRAGIVGSNAAKAWFTDPRNNWPRNKPSTIKNKLRTLKGKDYRAAMDLLDEYISDPSTDISSIDTPLVDSGELRRAITWVIGEDKK